MPYAPAVESLLTQASAKPGMRVRVTTGKPETSEARVLEGQLMPSASLHATNHLVLKLDSGYNLGVALDSHARVVVLDATIRALHFPKVKESHDSGLPVIGIVATGGTISSRVDYTTGAAHMLLTPSEILAQAPEVAEFCRVGPVDSPFPPMPSEDLSPNEWTKIARATAKQLNTPGVRGVVVTHGTDSLAYSAAALSYFLPNLKKPVALVGAQRSPDRGSFDGAMNLACGARFAIGNTAGVCTVMHATNSDDYCHAILGTHVRKLHTSERAAFRAVNAPPVAKIWPDGGTETIWTEWADAHPVEPDSKVEVDDRFDPNIAIVKAHPGARPDILDYYSGKKFRGVVIEAMGLGHVPTQTVRPQDSWIPAIKRAVESGVFVAITSQAINGRVHPFVYSNLRRVSDAGAVFAEDMLSETAFVKLGWILGHHATNDHPSIRREFLTPMAGDITGQTPANTGIRD